MNELDRKRATARIDKIVADILAGRSQARLVIFEEEQTEHTLNGDLIVLQATDAVNGSHMIVKRSIPPLEAVTNPDAMKDYLRKTTAYELVERIVLALYCEGAEPEQALRT